MAEAVSPEPRWGHESVLIGDKLYLIGGWDGKSEYFPRGEIWTCNVREEKKWIRRVTKGKNIPPPCRGARCVVINGIVYTYGGKKPDGECLREVFGLDSKEMKWIQVATLTGAHGKKPWQRSNCCLWAIGDRLIMFGGWSKPIPQDLRQAGAQFKLSVNNEIFELKFEKRRETGYWLDVELRGERPQPRHSAATETIDEYRGLLHGGEDGTKYFDDAFVIDLRYKMWTLIDFLPKPSARSHHRMCRLSKAGFKEKNCFLLVGGTIASKLSDLTYILDFDKSKFYEFYVNPEIARIKLHTMHCAENADGSAQIIVSGGKGADGKFREPLIELTLGPSNESYMHIESQLLPLAELRSTVEHKSRRIQELERELEKTRLEVSKLQEDNEQMSIERTSWAAQCQILEEEKSQDQENKRRLAEDLIAQRTRCRDLETDVASMSIDFEERTRELDKERSEIEIRCNSLLTENGILRNRCRELETEKADVDHALEVNMRTLDESQRNLDQFMDVLNIRADQVRLTDEKLGSGAYADVIIGRWNKRPVAVKKFHDLITTPRTIPIFQREVLTASRLHHPNIVRVCGAVMEDDCPFQIVSELLEGSVSEVIDAAHASLSYLSDYEQLSIAVEMTSAISYLHGLRPCYVHADIRPTNVLVTRDMKVEVADLGAAHLVESSKSLGPHSPPYLAPERLPPRSARSSLPSDVYSLGVSLIEIFTGKGPIPEERNRQLMPLRNRRSLHVICSKMISDEERVEDRPTSEKCLAVLMKEMDEVVKNGCPDKKRRVTGKFDGEGDKRRHKVVLSDSYHV